MSADEMIRQLGDLITQIVDARVAAQLAGLQTGHRSDRRLTTQEVATRLRCSPAKVYDLERTGSLPAIRVGRLVRFRLSDVETYEAAAEGTK